MQPVLKPAVDGIRRAADLSAPVLDQDRLCDAIGHNDGANDHALVRTCVRRTGEQRHGSSNRQDKQRTKTLHAAIVLEPRRPPTEVLPAPTSVHQSFAGVPRDQRGFTFLDLSHSPMQFGTFAVAFLGTAVEADLPVDLAEDVQQGERTRRLAQ